MKLSTEELLKGITLTKDLNAYTQEQEGEFLTEAPHEYLTRKMRERGLELPELCKRSELEAYCYKILSGARKPSRDALLHIAIGLCFTLDETQECLRMFQTARLDPRVYRDAALIFAISKQYTLQQTAALLSEVGEAEL